MSRFIEQFRIWFAATTDSPMEFATLSALSALSGIALGRRWMATQDKQQANLFGMLVGPAGAARKGTALKRARELLKVVEPTRIGPTDYTSEALYDWMLSHKNEQGKNQQRVVLFATEFGSDLARMEAYAKTMKADFCSLFDCEPIDKVRRGGKPVNIPEPCVSFLAACAYPMMTASLKPSDWYNGYMMRFVYVAPINMRAEIPSTPLAQPVLEKNATIALQGIRDEIYQTPFGVQLSPEAEEMLIQSRTYHNYYVPKSSEILKDYAARFWGHVTKMAMLWQLDIDPSSRFVDREAMRLACEFAVNICWPSFNIAFEKTAAGDFRALATMVSTMIIESANKGIFRSTIATKFMGRRELTDVIMWLKANRLIRIVGQQYMHAANSGDELIFWDADLPPQQGS